MRGGEEEEKEEKEKEEEEKQVSARTRMRVCACMLAHRERERHEWRRLFPCGAAERVLEEPGAACCDVTGVEGVGFRIES